MSSRRSKSVTCPVCGQSKPVSQMVPGAIVREPVVKEIREVHPDWTADAAICQACLNHYRTEHVNALVEQEKGELLTLEEEVIRSLHAQESVSKNINAEFQQRHPERPDELALGESVPDRLRDGPRPRQHDR